ncbi:uncharacterized protein MELLADRAFT_112230 [Melampsora larici-populina 98AG31]|uniref:Uncharacterized protein n=1 Tax=Melampsora larici-populina (strain 98AG31 / pathotype 3-4-7) TaxID=747676 RepID=F4S5S9_MELLP|nr:uncharacterized protein MELLADRAFT_112230 [Melampsora larici-populina 98AG31]EGG00011.1 hypothetical protein MELLADRAFT_112230 [Melampsora larici-populina 98AG31]
MSYGSPFAISVRQDKRQPQDTRPRRVTRAVEMRNVAPVVTLSISKSYDSPYLEKKPTHSESFPDISGFLILSAVESIVPIPAFGSISFHQDIIQDRFPSIFSSQTQPHLLLKPPCYTTMTNLSIQSSTPPDKGWLPYDIVSQIVDIFVSDLGHYRYDDHDTSSDEYLLHESITELLQLRLVSKTWSEAVIPFAFHSMELHSSKAVQVILDNWSKIQAPDRPCPVKRLIIQDLFFVDHTNEKSVKGLKSTVIFMDQAVKLIELIGENLNELTMLFVDGFGIAPNLVKAVKRIKDLKKLCIQDGEGYDLPAGYVPQSLSDLLVAVPKLQAFTLEYVVLMWFQLKSPALSNLQYFNFRFFPNNLDAIGHIVKTAKESLKIIEYRGDFKDARLVFGPIANTLEGLITYIVEDDIPQSAKNMKFPKLRLFRTRLFREPDRFGRFEHFLNWPIFHSIRTLVLDSYEGAYYLTDHLERGGKSPFENTPNLKHIIFMIDESSGGCSAVTLKLVEDLKTYGIRCHMRPESKPEKLMMDYIMYMDGRLEMKRGVK